MTAPVYWIATADGRKASLFECSVVPGGRWHCEPRGSIESKWEGYHDHGRPSLMGRGPGPGTGAAHSHAGSGHEPEEEQRRFSRDIREWLGREAKDHVTVFVASRMLGWMRHDLADLGDRVELHEGELTRLRAHELVAHVTVRRVLEEARSASQGT